MVAVDASAGVPHRYTRDARTPGAGPKEPAMRTRRIALAVALLIGALAAAHPRDPALAGADDTRPPEAAAPDPLESALAAALDDERHAIAFYAAVIEKHGERRPFSNIIRAERRHADALLAQYERLGLTPPDDPWPAHDFDVPDDFAEVCDLAVVSEIRNARMYDDLMRTVDDGGVQRVFESLRRASIERHLRAFQRHSSGWETIEPDGLTERQRAQRERALDARDDMFASLLGELTGAMTDGGPDAAIEVCAARAPEIAAAAAKEHGVRIGRTSWKLRNPGNEPPVWAELLIDERPTEPVVLADRRGRLATLTPITVAAPCLKCHGPADELAPGVGAALERLYPDDRATGFREGDLRGWFWVEVPAD